MKSTYSRPTEATAIQAVEPSLIVRAMVTRPPVLLLDEPVAGLDATAKGNVLAMIGRLASTGTSLVYVTHHEAELVDSITHVALMEKGRLAFQGTRQQFRERTI